MGAVLVMNATGVETRVALVENGTISEYYLERKKDKGIVGNIYKGKVVRVLPGMQAAFVDIGLEKAAFLYVSDVFYDPDFSEQQFDLTEGEHEEIEDLPEATAEEAEVAPAAAAPAAEAKAEQKPAVAAAPPSEKQPEAKPEPKPEEKAEAAAAPQGEQQPEAKAEQVAAAPQAEKLPEQKVEPKPEQKAEAAVAPQGEKQPEAKAEEIAAGQAEAVAAPQGEKQPEAKAEEIAAAQPEGAARPAPEAAAAQTEPRPEQQITCSGNAPALAPPQTIAPEAPAEEGEAEGEEEKAEGHAVAEKPAGERPQGDRGELRVRGRRRRRGGARRESRDRNEQQKQQQQPQENKPEQRQESRPERQERQERGERHDRGDRHERHEGDGHDRESKAQKKTANIQDLLKVGQEIIVQVAKDPIGTKGARVTSHISLPGRHLVFMPTVDHVGISRRIERESERRRLREIVDRLRPAGTGFIVRTVAENVSTEKLEADAKFLIGIWNAVGSKKERLGAPVLLHPDLDLALRATRDLFAQDVEKLVIDDRAEWDRVSKFVEAQDPALKERVVLHDSDEPIFDAYGIEHELQRAQSRKVWLKSGGYLIIDQAEALTAIDVNSGRYVGKKSLEETITRINIEAAKEIVYQLRLRNIGGIMIIDFIDMDKAQNRDKVFKALQDALGRDKAKTNILKISELGLVEMTRKRVRESLGRTLNEPCSYCDGRGHLKSKRTVAYEIFREIRREATNFKENMLVVNCHPDVGRILQVDERDELRYLMDRFNKSIHVRAQPSYHQEQFDIYGKSERPSKRDRDGGEERERGDRGERGERSERGDRGERGERSERGERGERSERGDRGERRQQQQQQAAERREEGSQSKSEPKPEAKESKETKETKAEAGSKATRES